MTPRRLVPVRVRLAGLAALLAGCGTEYGPVDPAASFQVTLEAEGRPGATVRGDSAAWRNEGHPIHRVFRLVLHAPDAPAGYPDGAILITVGGYGSMLAGTAIPAVGTWPVNPATPALGTSVSVEIGERWQGTAVAGALVIERADAEAVTGALDVELAVRENLEPRPAVSLRGRFTAVAWEE